ncbi:hypothetical protein QJS10_CPB21g01154 [Acorus calamus]|uniref:Uncharacterized protein n=1 Tax=Acorus calamus TaxID=4465 RepID=A0AAV9C5F4_ACOCL|nr:hypothetical protein QJS10_CPB21g01154 [Acorus calamus]
MRSHGFDPNWVRMVKACVSTAKASVLVNGLRINFGKSSVAGINVEEDFMSRMTNIMGCQRQVGEACLGEILLLWSWLQKITSSGSGHVELMERHHGGKDRFRTSVPVGVGLWEPDLFLDRSLDRGGFLAGQVSSYLPHCFGD